MKDNYHDYLNNNFAKMQETIKTIQNITSSDIKHKEISQNLNNMNNQLGNSISKIIEESNHVNSNLETDTYNIAFFGETNAGKSTIIEALICGDGKSIGDGRQDYTQKLETRNLDSINLIDLPGMEGNESKYISEIKKGIAKAHAIIYVSSGDKEPEETTLMKIKSYLRDQTDIYSVVNIRKPLNPHTLKVGLVGDKEKIVIESTEKKFKNAFGKNFKRTFALNAKVGFVCRSQNKNPEAKKSFNTMLKYIDFPKDIYQYSNFENLNNLIKKLNNIELQNKKIKISNTYKFLSINNYITSIILKSKKDLDAQIRKIEDENLEVVNNFKSESQLLEQKLDATINRNFDELLANLSNLISTADDKSKEEINKKIKQEIDAFNKKFKVDIKNEFEVFTQKMKHTFKEMNEQILTNLKYSNIDNGYINIDETIKEVSANFNYIFKNILGIIFSAVISIPLGQMVMIVTAASSIISRIFKWEKVDKKKEMANKKKELIHLLNVKMTNLKHKLRREIKSNTIHVNRNINKQLREIDNHISQIKKLSFKMNSQINTLNSLNNETSKKLVESIEEKEYFFVYIDKSMNGMFYIGSKIKYAHLYNLKYIIHFEDINEFLIEYEHTLKDGFFYVNKNEEFQKRAISEMIKELNNLSGQKKYKGVKKRFSRL
ncbi:GTPase [Macrococcus capreoli]